MTNKEAIKTLSSHTEYWRSHREINGIGSSAVVSAIEHAIAELKKDSPDWSNAPDWANFRAQDSDGEWNWYENKPIRGEFFWESWKSGGKYEQCQREIKGNWEETLQERPQHAEKKS